MTATLTVASIADLFPPTTSVGAYPVSGWNQSQLPPSGAPPVSPDSSGTVASDGSLSITGLAYSTRYFLGASVSGTWRFRQASTGAAPVDVSSAADLAAGLATKQSLVNWQGTLSTNFSSPVAVTLDPITPQGWRGTLNANTTFNVSNVQPGAVLYIKGLQGSPARTVTISDGTNTQTITAGGIGLPSTAGQLFTLTALWIDATNLEVRISIPGGFTVTKSQVTDFYSGQAFGDAADGALVFDGTTTVAGLVPSSNVYTMTRDLMATTLTINSGATVKMAGYMLFATGAVTINGTLSFDGNAAAGAAAGAVVQKSVASLAAAAGGTGAGAAATTPTGMLGGASTASGAGTPGAAGGANALVGSLTATQIQQRLKSPAVAAVGAIAVAGTLRQLCGGSSGSSGGGDGTNSGGGGGAGGGIVVICANSLTIGATGVISAVGGAGGTPSTGNCGGGAGGGGGGLLAFTRSAMTNGGAITLTGGAGGTKTGTGANGGTGATGVSLNVVVG